MPAPFRALVRSMIFDSTGCSATVFAVFPSVTVPDSQQVDH